MTTKVAAAMTVEAVTAAQLALKADFTPMDTRVAALEGGSANIKLSGDVVKVANTQTGAMSSGTTQIPLDDTIPQSTEGDQYMTLSITPSSATNYLRVDVIAHLTGSNGGSVNTIAALFRDSGTDAVAAQVRFSSSSAFHNPFAFSYYVLAGSTAATTFKLRAGTAGAGTTTFNGASGARQLGGVMISSMTITEIKP